MAKDPGFIKLAPPWQRRIIADIKSGFTLSGLGVAPFPKDKEQAKFVRKMIQAGRLVPATAEQYDAISEQKDLFAARALDADIKRNSHQESNLQGLVHKVTSSIQGMYDGDEFDLPEEAELGDDEDVQPEPVEEEVEAEEEGVELSSDSLKKMTVPELRELAAEMGIELAGDAKKADIVDAILESA